MKFILCLCTGNSARSILAEAVLNARGIGRFKAASAGSQPKGQPHPLALETLSAAGYATAGLRSKSWDEFMDAADIDIVITLCDSAARESCPVWPGSPITAHWGLPDPANILDEDAARSAFRSTLKAIETRVDLLMSLPVDSINREQLALIGRQ